MLRPAALLAAVVVLWASPTPTPHGTLVKVGDGHVEIAVAGPTGFRVSASYSPLPLQPIPTIMVNPPPTYPTFKRIQNGTTSGIETSFGSTWIDPSGAFELRDSQGKTLASSSSFTTHTGNEPKGDTCKSPTPNTDVNGGRRTPSCPDGLKDTTQATCCTACNKDKDCTLWIYAPSGPDPTGHNCWLMMDVTGLHPSSSRNTGGNTGGPPTVRLNLNGPTKNPTTTTTTRYYGTGGGSDIQHLNHNGANPYVHNTQFEVPHYWSTDGYSILAVSPYPSTPNNFANYPASWTSQGEKVQWIVMGNQADIYLSPANDPESGVRTHWDITGLPRLPPKYAFGFLACRWGWVDRTYIHKMLTEFRSGDYPIDAWISDFGWYTDKPDYSLPNTGSPTFKDFSYNNVTFPEPVDQLKEYHGDLHMRFGGIRKPRLGNSQLLTMAAEKGWLIGQPEPGPPGKTRNLNYSIPEVREWYAAQHAQYLKDGVDFWWNDEGETDYFTFFYWNIAETLALQSHQPGKRFFTINRSYQPGMQRLGTTIWTGDVSVSWAALAEHPGYLLNWGLAGVGYVTCDIGGFSGPDDPPDLLVRWYELGVFLPVMRVHSTRSDKPHFPFLYPGAPAAAMKSALNLRYQLLPMFYSLAHRAATEGTLVMRPLLMNFPTDPHSWEVVDQWMVGTSLMAAPVLSQDSTRNVYLPPGVWYEYGTTTTHKGATNLSLTNVPLDHIPVYVHTGGIIPVGPVVQYTDQLPGGPLTVQVYPGSDGNFILVEDDGATYDYEKGAFRSVGFQWSDNSKTLTWSVKGSYTGASSFTQVKATAFFAGGQKTSSTHKIANGGTISF